MRDLALRGCEQRGPRPGRRSRRSPPRDQVGPADGRVTFETAGRRRPARSGRSSRRRHRAAWHPRRTSSGRETASRFVPDRGRARRSACAARLGDAEDRDHRRDPDGDPERRECAERRRVREGHGRRLRPRSSGPRRPDASAGREPPRARHPAHALWRPRSGRRASRSARQRGRDLAVVGDDDDRRAVVGVSRGAAR